MPQDCHVKVTVVMDVPTKQAPVLLGMPGCCIESSCEVSGLMHGIANIKKCAFLVAMRRRQTWEITYLVITVAVR